MSCLITGCALVDPAHNRWRWGDLHQVGSAFVHYCIQARNEYDAWQEGTESLPVHFGFKYKALYIHEHGMPFMRGGVVVVAALDASLNSTATEYLR